MNRLKELRKKKKLTQKEMAEELEVPYRSYQRWENGEVQIKKENLKKLSKHFNISIPNLLGYEEKINKTKEIMNDSFDVEVSEDFFEGLYEVFQEQDIKAKEDVKLGKDVDLNEVLKVYFKDYMDVPNNDKSLLKFQSYVVVITNFLKGKTSLTKEEVESMQALSKFLKYYGEYFTKSSTLIELLLEIKTKKK